MDMKPQFKAYATCPAEDWVVEKPNKNDSWVMNHSPEPNIPGILNQPVINQ